MKYRTEVKFNFTDGSVKTVHIDTWIPFNEWIDTQENDILKIGRNLRINLASVSYYEVVKEIDLEIRNRIFNKFINNLADQLQSKDSEVHGQ